MDKMKKLKRAVARYHFWVLCPTIAVFGLVSWYVTTTGLSKEYDTNHKTIVSKLDSLRKIQKTPKHPNETFISETRSMINVRQENVHDAWFIKYKRTPTLMKWPPALLPDFIEAAEQLFPIEKKVKVGEEPLTINFRERYRDHIKGELPRLAKIINSKWTAKEIAAPVAQFNFGGPIRNQDDTEPEVKLEDHESVVVEWDDANQEHIQTNHFDWSREPDGAPSTLQVLYAQEDMWVLEALLEIIAKTNDHVQIRNKAAIKRIEYIYIGKEAGQGNTGRVYRVVGASTSTEPAIPVAPVVVQTSEVNTRDPANGRYVNRYFEPVNAESLRNAVENVASSDVDAAFLAVAKRMPIRMRLVMDQSRLDRFLVECANWPLMVEINQVRYNPAGGPARPVGGGRPGVIPGHGGIGGIGGPPGIPGAFRPPTPIPGLRPNVNNNNNPPVGDADDSFDRAFEFFGIIYIYNEVDRKMLGLGDRPAAAQPVAPPEAAVPVAVPAEG